MAGRTLAAAELRIHCATTDVAPPPDPAAAPVPSPTTASSSIQHRALAVLLLLSFVATAWVAAPLYVGLVFGTAMAFSAQPLFGRLVHHLHRRWLAAALTTGFGGTVMLAGFAGIVLVLVKQVVNIIGLAQKKLDGATVQSLLGTRGVKVFAAMHVDPTRALSRLQAQIGDLSGQAAGAVGMVLSITAGAVLASIVALYTMYYVTLEWPRLSVRSERVLPFDPKHTRALISEFRDVVRTAFVGTLATGIVQGVLAGIGFALTGTPQPLAWAALTIVASLVPVFGTGLVWGPVAAFLLMDGRPAAAIFIVIWGLLVVMAVSDYIIRPRLAGRGNEGHPLLMLLGLLGGVEVFGIAGLVVGPVVVSLYVAVLRIYEREKNESPACPAPAA